MQILKHETPSIDELYIIYGAYLNAIFGVKLKFFKLFKFLEIFKRIKNWRNYVKNCEYFY